jgi:hypothetical protein
MSGRILGASNKVILSLPRNDFSLSATLLLYFHVCLLWPGTSYKHCGEFCCLHLQDRTIRRGWRGSGTGLVGFEVLTPVVMKNSVFWDITPCSPLKVKRRFRWTYRKQGLPFASFWFLAWLILRPWRWRRHVLPKRQSTFNGLHGVIAQKI